MTKVFLLLIKTIVFIFITFPIVANAQYWTRVGNDIDGEAAGDESGTSVSLSSDGTRVAIGAPRNDDAGNAAGHVRVYDDSPEIKATTINIPGDYSTIQEGIDSSVDGDTILIQPGVYAENINYNGKNIVVGSLYMTTNDTYYISSTILDGNQTASVVTFNTNENNSAKLIGVTVQNGSAENGGGILCGNSCAPTLDHLYVINNTANQFGGGIYLDVGASAKIQYSLIANNQASGLNGNGGGIGGTGLFLTPVIQNCTIVGNAAWESGSGIYILNTNSASTNVQIINSIVKNEKLLATWTNRYEDISSQQNGSTQQNDDNFTISYSLVQGGWTGQVILDADPQFVDYNSNNYLLQASSPCINSGHPDPQYNDPDGSTSDMGAFEFGAIVGIENNSLSIPQGFSLSQNHPNPFNPTTTIHHILPEESDVTISIYNLLGKKISQLTSETQNIGSHTIQWNGTDQQGNPVPAGIYFYQLQAGDFVQTKKMVLMK